MESEEDRLERLSDEEFIRTGIFKTEIEFDLSITYNDMLHDLIKRTEGSNIDVNKPGEN